MAVRQVSSFEEFLIEYPRVQSWLEQALKYRIGEQDERTLRIKILERQYELWVSDNAACVTEIAIVDGVQVCFLVLVAGEHGRAMTEILNEGQELIEAYAKSRGCLGLYGVGRPEWKRVLEPQGFKAVSVNFYKEFK